MAASKVYRACLFDMDGLLLNTEDLYTLVTNKILHENGRPSMPWSIKAQLQGRPGVEAAKIFHEWAKLPITPEEYATRQAELQTEYFPTSEPLPGVRTLLESLHDLKIPIALATSSLSRTYALKTKNHQSMFSLFLASRRVLGDDPRIQPGHGKPAPDIYLLALESINHDLRKAGESEIEPAECLVFEDAVLGVQAGRRAGMHVIWCPHPMLLEEYRGREDELLHGPIQLDHGKALEDKSLGTAELVTTLQDFDLNRYGLR